MECNLKTCLKFNNLALTMMFISSPKWSNPLPSKKKKTKNIKLTDSFPSERLSAWKWTLSFKIKTLSLLGENKFTNPKLPLTKCIKPSFSTSPKTNSFISGNLPSKAITSPICSKTTEILQWLLERNYLRTVTSKRSIWTKKIGK